MIQLLLAWRESSPNDLISRIWGRWQKTEARFTNHFLRKLLFWVTVDGCEMLGNGLYPFHQRSLVQKHQSYGRMFRGSLVNHVILMSASSCQPLWNKSGSEQWKGVIARNSPYNKFFLRGIVFLWRKNMVWIKECQGSVAAWKQNQTA